MQIERGKAHSDDLLRGKTVASSVAADRNLATALVLGVLRWQIQSRPSDSSPCSSTPNAKLDAEVLIALAHSAHFSFCILTAFPRTPQLTRASSSPSRPAIASHPAWSMPCCANSLPLRPQSFRGDALPTWRLPRAPVLARRTLGYGFRPRYGQRNLPPRPKPARRSGAPCDLCG